MPNLVFMVEERSMEEALTNLLPSLLPPGFRYLVIPHSGKTDLLASIPRKLRAWRTPDTRFIVLVDQDLGDCIELKEKVVGLCSQAGRPESLVRIVCRNLEAWFIGDFAAIESAYSVDLGYQRNKAKYREPDQIAYPARELDKLLNGYSKIKGARQISGKMNIHSNRSGSFNCFIQGLLRLTADL